MGRLFRSRFTSSCCLVQRPQRHKKRNIIKEIEEWETRFVFVDEPGRVERRRRRDYTLTREWTRWSGGQEEKKETKLALIIWYLYEGVALQLRERDWRAHSNHQQRFFVSARQRLILFHFRVPLWTCDTTDYIWRSRMTEGKQSHKVHLKSIREKQSEKETRGHLNILNTFSNREKKWGKCRCRTKRRKILQGMKEWGTWTEKPELPETLGWWRSRFQ